MDGKAASAAFWFAQDPLAPVLPVALPRAVSFTACFESHSDPALTLSADRRTQRRHPGLARIEVDLCTQPLITGFLFGYGEAGKAYSSRFMRAADRRRMKTSAVWIVLLAVDRRERSDLRVAQCSILRQSGSGDVRDISAYPAFDPATSSHCSATPIRTPLNTNAHDTHTSDG